MRRLRAKLGPEHEALIGTVRNVGYRFVPLKLDDGRRGHPREVRSGELTPDDDLADDGAATGMARRRHRRQWP